MATPETSTIESAWSGAALLAPFRAFHDPAGAAHLLLKCSTAVFLATLLWQSLLLGCALMSLALATTWFDTATGTWRSWSEARRILNNEARLGACEAAGIAGIALGLLLPAMMAAFYLTRTLRDQSMLAALFRNYRAAAATLLVSTGTFAFFGGAFLAAARHEEWLAIAGRYWDRFALPMIVAVMFWTAMCELVAIVERALRAADTLPPPLLPPRCEGCGYDLSHQPASGACSECNEPVARSLLPGVRRPGTPWECGEPTFLAWLNNSYQLLFSPSSFYARLRLRDGDEPARRFCLFHYRYIAFVAALWVTVMFVITSLTNLLSLESLQSTGLGMLSCVALLIALAQGTPLGRFRPWDRSRTLYFLLPAFVIFVGTERLGGWQLSARESFFIPLVFGFVAALVCWFGHRLAACIVLILPLRAKILLDWHWAEKIICYESVFLWVYCVVWGVLISSFVLFGGWMSNSPAFDGLRRATGLLAEPTAVLAVTILLSMVWAWRYAVALRAARWNNF